MSGDIDFPLVLQPNACACLRHLTYRVLAGWPVSSNRATKTSQFRQRGKKRGTYSNNWDLGRTHYWRPPFPWLRAGWGHRPCLNPLPREEHPLIGTGMQPWPTGKLSASIPIIKTVNLASYSGIY